MAKAQSALLIEGMDCAEEVRALKSEVEPLQGVHSLAFDILNRKMIVNHDDSTREFLYQEKTNASLNEAAKNKWHVISMKDDWKKIFP